MTLETVFRYRTLVGKCDLGVGLEWDEIDEVSRIEYAFASPRRDGRRFRRHAVELVAMLRGDQINDRVAVVEIGPGGLVCSSAPFIAHGELVEISIDLPAQRSRDAARPGEAGICVGDESYRFAARGVWLADEELDYRVGLRFVGMPVRLHRVQISEHTLDVVDRIGIAA